ncbi:MAG: extracellular solute-binding protein, partial [Spirochaetaceae bacterium]
MKQLRLTVVLVLVLLLLTSLVYARGGREEPKPTVTVLWALYDGLTEEFRAELQAAFMQEYPDINLDIVPVPWDQMYDRITTSLAGGRPPEVSVIGTRWALEFMELDAIA